MADPGTTWMPLYVADYLRDTGHLTVCEHGAYLLLIMQAWTREGALPLDEDRLRLLAKMDKKDWKMSRGTLLAFFVKTEDGYRHKRVDHELSNTTAMIDQRRTAGRASAEARRLKREANEISTTVATEPSTESQRDARPSPSPSPSQEAAAAPLIQEVAPRAKPAVNGHRHGGRHMPTLDSPWPAWEWLTNGEVEITGANAERRPCAGGFYLDAVARDVCDAAGIDGHTGGIDWSPLVTWLRAGIGGDVIVSAIKKVAGRDGYEPKTRLTYFDKPVREAAGK